MAASRVLPPPTPITALAPFCSAMFFTRSISLRLHSPLNGTIVCRTPDAFRLPESLSCKMDRTNLSANTATLSANGETCAPICPNRPAPWMYLPGDWMAMVCMVFPFIRLDSIVCLLNRRINHSACPDARCEGDVVVLNQRIFLSDRPTLHENPCLTVGAVKF